MLHRLRNTYNTNIFKVVSYAYLTILKHKAGECSSQQGRRSRWRLEFREYPWLFNMFTCKNQELGVFPSKEQSLREPQNRWGPGGVLRSGVPHSCQQYSRGLGSSQASALHCREHADDLYILRWKGGGGQGHIPITLSVWKWRQNH